MKPIGMALALLAALALAGCNSKSDAPDSLAQVVLNKIGAKDWRGIYNMASAEEKAEMGIDQEQYQRLCETLTEGFPDNLGVKLQKSLRTSETERHYMFNMEKLPLKAPDIDGGSPNELIPCVLKRVKGQWYPVICYFPLHLVQFQQELKQARRKRILKAMENARVAYLIMFESHTKLSVEDQRLVVQGKLDQDEAFR